MRFETPASISVLAVALLFVTPPAISQERTGTLTLRGFVTQSGNERERLRVRIEDRSCTNTDRVRCEPIRQQDIDRGRLSIFSTRTITLE